MMQQELIKVNCNAAYNQGHLIHYMKLTEYLKDKSDMIWEAWVELDTKRVREYQELQESLLELSRKKPHKKYRLPPSRLNLCACPSKEHPEPQQTQELTEALEYIARLHKTDAELQAMDGHPSTSTSSAT
jgi:hypothetical protein